MRNALEPSQDLPDSKISALLSELDEIAGLGSMVLRRDGCILFLNESMARWLAWHEGLRPQLQDLQPHLFKQCFGSSEDSESAVARFDSFTFSLSRKGLSEDIPCAGLKVPLSGNAGEILLLCWFEERNLPESPGPDTGAMIQALISKAPIGILSLNGNWECNFANVEASQLCNLPNEQLLRRGWSRLFSQHDALLQKMINQLLSTGIAQIELELEQTGLGSKILQIDVRGSVNESGTLEHAVCALVDVTDRVHRQQEIHQLANFDAVTGLYNRLAMKHQLERYLELAKRLRQKVQILFVDLDGFKNINDLYGHAVGDQVLVLAAERLRNQVRQNDVVARFGGDEFVIIIPGETPDKVVDSIAGKVNEVLRKPYIVDEVALYLTASIGISSFVGDERSEHVSMTELRDEMLKQADLAMYAAKNEGKNQYRRFNVNQGEEITLSYWVGQFLPAAIENGEIFFHYQPLIDIASGEIMGVEALMRWQHDTLGWVNPEVIVKVAEANGKIIDLQHYMIESTIRDFEHLLDQLPESRRDLRLSINICAIQLFDVKYTERIAELFEQSRIRASQVTLELTEGTLIEDRIEINSNLAFLKEQGFKIALDDFGTGYSALSYLTKFPIDIVKLDKSFIHSLGEGQQAALVKGCVQLAHSLDMGVVAEGIESETEYQTVGTMGCDFTQGYFHSKPINMSDLLSWITASK